MARRWLRSLCLIGVVLLAACGRSEPLSLGFISGQTGAFADLGTAGANGAILAVEQRNAQGGIGGVSVRLLIRDDQHDTRAAKLALQSLIDDKVLAVIGSMTSAMSVEMIPIANAAEVVLMGGTVVTNRVTGKDDFFLRAIAPACAYVAFSAGEHWRLLRPARVAVLYDLANRDYAEDWAENYATAISLLGQTAVKKIPFDSRAAPRMDGLIASILEGNPALVACACSVRSAAEIVRQLHLRAPAVHFAVSAWAASQTLLEQAGAAAEGVLVEQYHNLGDDSAKYRDFLAAYQRRFGVVPDYAAVIAYDATNVVLDALAEHPKRQGLKEAILKRQRFPGLQGEIVFDAYGDVSRQGFMTRVEKGRFVPLPAAGGA